MKTFPKLHTLLSFLICLLMMVAVSLRRDGKVLRHEWIPQPDTTTFEKDTPLRTTSEGSLIVNTTRLSKDIIGYGGTVPVEITLKAGKVVKVVALNNSETPAFFRDTQPLFQLWEGKSLEEAQALQVDVISGATYSSQAIIRNVQRGLSYAAQNNPEASIGHRFETSPQAIAGLIVVLLAALLPLWVKNPYYRLFQQMLNVVVLGFWCGSFLNYTALIAYLSNGMDALSLLIPVVMLITAFLYPFFGKKGHYCAHVCPFGSLQDLTSRCVPRKRSLTPPTLRRLQRFRQILWAVLMLCLWTGIWFDWVAYEAFSAFLVQSASAWVIGLALLFVALSAFLHRPYCRFVCPTGTLIRYSHSLVSKRKG